jgi:hypothetical protein
MAQLQAASIMTLDQQISLLCLKRAKLGGHFAAPRKLILQTNINRAFTVTSADAIPNVLGFIGRLNGRCSQTPLEAFKGQHSDRSSTVCLSFESVCMHFTALTPAVAATAVPHSNSHERHHCIQKLHGANGAPT